MSKIDKVLSCIKPGEPIRAETVIERTGLSLAEVGPLLCRLHQRAQIVRLEQGVYTRASSAPLPPEQIAEMRAELRRVREEHRKRMRKLAQSRFVANRRERARIEVERAEAKKTGRRVDGIVHAALASRHPLHSAWAPA
jgi:hypothetical protein